MKKIFFTACTIVLASLAVGAGIFSAAWYMQSQRAKQAVEAVVADLNARGYEVGYQAIETGGFPFSLTVRIVQPHYKLHMDTLFQDWQKKVSKTLPPAYLKDALTLDAPALPAWTEEGTLGTITYGIDLTSDRMFLRAEGGSAITSTIGSDARTLASEMQSPAQCTLQTQPSVWHGGLWMPAAALGADLQTFVHNFRSFQCTAPGRVIKDAASGEMLASSEGMTLSLTSFPDQEARNTQFSLTIPRSIATPAFDAYLNRYAALFPHLLSSSPHSHYSAYGESSIDIALRLRHPGETAQWTKLSPITATLERFAVKNALYTQTLDMSFDYRPQEQGKWALIMNLAGNFSPAFDTFFADAMISQLRALSHNPRFQALRQSLAIYTDEQLAAIVKPAVFSLSAFGPLQLHVDALGARAADNTPNLTLNGLDFSSAPYAVSAKGSRQAGAPAQFTITCRNLLPLVDDGFNYATRLRSIAVQLSPAFAASFPVPSAEFAAGVKQFLAALGEPQKDSSGNDLLIYAYRTDGAAGPSVNGKPMDQLAALYQQYIFPYIKESLGSMKHAKQENNNEWFASPASPAAAYSASLAQDTSSIIPVPIHEMMDFNFKSKKEIYELRTGFVAQHPQFIQSEYAPSDAVFGQIEDGKPWWGILGRSYYGDGQQSILGPAEESRFIANPFLLVALDSGHAVKVKSTGITPVPIYPVPLRLSWRNDYAQAAVTYDLTSFVKESIRIGDPRFPNHMLTLVAYNARDLGWNYLYVSPEESSNVVAASHPAQIRQFIHTGGSCGYPGGCNNMSPFQDELEIKVDRIPARAYIKLWKNAPADASAPADMVFIIEMI